MQRDDDTPQAAVDEYLWPLTGEVAAIDWEALVEELQIRERLAQIQAHVRETHVVPRLQRLGERASPALARATVQAVINGPEGGTPWEQTLREPVPRALRDEWRQLAQRLREIDARRRP